MLSLLAFLLLIFKTTEASCPLNTVEWNSNCFSFISYSTGFEDAELKCTNFGGHLASIHDGFTNGLLAQEAKNNFSESTEADFWIGATNLMKPPTWNWTDGTPFDFTDWKKGEPQNTTGLNCAALSINDGFWSAQDCFKAKLFVSNVPSTPTYPISYNCSEGSWTAAENNCQNLGGHLPSIHSFEEFHFILSYVFASWNNIWTGLYSPEGGRTWTNSDGSVSDYLKAGNWCLGFPSDSAGQRCALIGQSKNLGCYWDEDCNSFKSPSICKKSAF
uniref:C-type lectin domain-containing protein n=1 Tax=Panagrolaimus sp. PS1159 TaxID=55785 RepID=A0AC35F6N4_9BILA